MTGRETPEFDDLGSGRPPGDGQSSDDRPSGDAPDWFNFDLSDESPAVEPDGRPNAATPERAAPPVNGGHGRGNGRNGNSRNDHHPSRPAPRPRRAASVAVARGQGSVAAAERGPTKPPAPNTGYDDDLMTALAAAAAAAPDSEEAALLAAALAPLALAVVGPAARALRPALPALVKGAAALAAWLVDEEARDLLRLLPPILEETVRELGRAAAQNRPITRALAGDLLAEQTEQAIARHGRREHRRRNRGRGQSSQAAGRPHPANNGTARPQPARRHDAAERHGPPAWETTSWDASDEDDCC